MKRQMDPYNQRCPPVKAGKNIVDIDGDVGDLNDPEDAAIRQAAMFSSARIERGDGVTVDYGGELDTCDSSWVIDPSEVTMVHFIGEGSTASVYKGRIRGVDIAVKELSTTKEEYTLAFQRELDVLVKVHHPHIVKFVGVFGDGADQQIWRADHLQLCLEFCEGGSLWDLLYNKLHKSEPVRIAWWQRIVMLYDTATAVAYMHSFKPKIVHRDLKSLNVLLAKRVEHELDEPIVKLCDFGFAREFDGDSTLTAGAGTCHWMAPEVSSGSPYTETADSFSFAMIGYEVVCRRIPFVTQDQYEVHDLLRRGKRPLPDHSYQLMNDNNEEEQAPPGLLRLIELCWHHDPGQRPTFTQIWQDLIEVSRNTSEELKVQTPSKLTGKCHI